MSFENYYLSNLFRETGEDITNLEQCLSVRNSLARLHNEGLKSLSNSSTCVILNQRLEDYFQMCNNESKDSPMEDRLSLVNNFIKGKVQTRHCANWKSKLRSHDVEHKELFWKSMENTGHCNSQNKGLCKANDTNEVCLKELLKKKVYTPNIVETKPVNKNSNNLQSNNIFKPKMIRSNSGGIVNSFNNVFEQKDEQMSHSSSDQFNSVYKSSHRNPSVTSFNSNSGARNSYNIPSESNKYTNENKGTAAQQNNDTNQVNSFRTARAELNIQNKKKYGNNKQNYQSVPEPNVIVKRSLGTTRSSVQNKFVPPLASSESPKACEPMDETEEDERLKHIDPKMVEFIRSEIIDSSAPIGWDDIAGLEFAKSAIQEAVVWPLLRPDIFTGLRRPPKGILLFGPPGTGKTLIGKCIASQCCATFFSISASSLTSKWIGDGEKMVRALFAVARCHQPAVVFIDEIDSLLTQRSDSEHEATRRIKTEFLVQLDGAATGDEDRFLVIGATNRPQELDEAARRRLVKRLYIPLPDTNARQQIIQRLMMTERNSLSDHDVAKISQLTDGYSGADMRSLCSEAALGPIRAVPLSQITNIHCDQVRPVNAEDFERALTRVRPSVSGNDLEHYITWDKTYGSGST